MDHGKPVFQRFLISLAVGLVIISVTGPVVVSVASALVPVILVLTAALVVLRLVWYFTNRY